MHHALVHIIASFAMVTTAATAQVLPAMGDATAPVAQSASNIPVRLAGDNDYGTAAEVAQRWPSGVSVAYVASGDSFSDALAAGARAGGDRAPVLLVSLDSVPSETDQALRRLKPQRLVIVGGDQAVSERVLSRLRQYATSGRADRAAGPDRYGTAAAVAASYPTGLPTVYLASGETFPDALAGAALAGHRRAPMLLTRQGQLDDATVAQLRRLKADNVVVLGGKMSVADKVAAEAAKHTTGGGFRRLAGKTRYETADVVAREFPSTRGGAVLVASGERYHGALVGAPLAARLGVPMILTPAERVHPGTASGLRSIAPTAMTVVGGPRIITEATVTALARFITGAGSPEPQTSFPSARATGVPEGWSPLKTVDGTYRVTTAGAVISDVRVNGRIDVAAPNVTLRRVEVIGGAIDNEAGGRCQNGLVVEDSTIRRGTDSTEGDSPAFGIGGYTARNVKIEGLPEGFRVGGRSAGCGPVTIEDSYVRVQSPDDCDDWHGDGLQGYDGAALTLRNTTLILDERAGCGGTAAFFYPHNQGNTSVDIDGLLVEGGGFPFRLGTSGSVTNLYVVDSWGYGPIEVRCSLLATWTASTVRLDTGGQPTGAASLRCGG